MRRTFLVTLALLAFLGLAVTPALAQAPAPKVTISGLLDFAASTSKNWSDVDVTNPRDTLSYTRERGRFDIIGQVGKSKAVWGVELDFSNGVSDGAAAAAPGTSAAFDLDTDVAGVVETKWLYVETPVTGAGSMMPFIPVATQGRFGAQPAVGHGYKFGLIWGGDFPGITLMTTWTPNVRSTLTYAQIGEALDRLTSGIAGATEDHAFLASVDLTVMKGLTIQPTYAYARYDSGNRGGSAASTADDLGTEPKGGFSLAALTRKFTERHYFGVDARWRMAGFMVEPSFYYLIGEQEINPLPAGATHAGKDEVDIRSWILDLIASYQLGPARISTRFMYTPGQEGQNHVVNGSDIAYYQTINSGFAYMTGGWTEIQTSNIEYNNSLLAGCPGCTLRQNPSYDKYGRIFWAIKGDYQFTPALNLYSTINFQWTDTEVDTNGVPGGTGIAQGLNAGQDRGDESYIGTEWLAGLTWRFAPSVALDLIYAYLWAGDALDNATRNGAGGASKPAHDVSKAVARIRMTF